MIVKRIMPFLIAFLAAACSAQDTASPYVFPTPVLNQQPTIFEVDVPSPASEARLADKRPNIILIMTDDQPFHSIDSMPYVKNELVHNGVRFDNAFATTPLCCPSRSSILSGQYAHNHGVLTNTLPLGGATLFDENLSFSIQLQESGYRTAYLGKYLNEYDALKPEGVIPSGWDVWNVFLGKNLNDDADAGRMQYYFDFSLSENGTIVDYEKRKDNFGADVITHKALEFISQSVDQPFFMAVSYYNPHSPYVPAPRHRETFRADTNWDWVQYRPPSFNEENVNDKPNYIKDLSPLSETDLDAAHKQILRSLLSVDDGAASIAAALKKAGLTENTIIIFTSDNGVTVGDHRFGVTKNCPYEACIKIPFVIYGPAYFSPRTDLNMVANIDLYPTIAEWAGFEPPATVDGDSLATLLEDPQTSWRSEILLEHWPTTDGGGALIPEFYSIRTAEWKYTEYSTGEVELYDLINDPYELENKAGKKQYKEIQAQLADQLKKLKEE